LWVSRELNPRSSSAQRLSLWFGHWLDFLGGRLQVWQLSLSLLSKRFHVQVTVALKPIFVHLYGQGPDKP
jgi:hypothetical protein